MTTKPKSLEEALNAISSTHATEDERWQLLALILREFMLAQGVDLEREPEDES